MTRAARIAGIVLAAGAGRRMGRPKADLRIDGQRLVDRAASRLRSAGAEPVVAVVRAGTTVDGAQVVINLDPERGMRSSLELAVASAPDVDALAVVLVDTPGLRASGMAAVLDAWCPGRIAVARYGARRGHPTVMSPELWRRALKLAESDEGARALMRAEPGLVDEINADGDDADLDTPDQLRTWVERTFRQG